MNNTLAVRLLDANFLSCLRHCASDKELVKEFDRLTNSNLSLKGSALELEIDKVSGRVNEDIEKFILFIDEYVYKRLASSGMMVSVSLGASKRRLETYVFRSINDAETSIRDLAVKHIADNGPWNLSMHSPGCGTEVFHYDSLDEMVAGFGRLVEQIHRRNDGMHRNFYFNAR